MAKIVLSVEEFLDLYGIGNTKLYELIKSGELTTRKCGRRRLIAVSDAETWFNSLAS